MRTMQNVQNMQNSLLLTERTSALWAVYGYFWDYFYHLTFLIWSLSHWRPCIYRNTTKGTTDPKVFLPKQEHILEDKYINHTSDPKYLGTDSRVDSIRRFVNLFLQLFVESECWTTQRYLNGFRHSIHLVFMFIICVRFVCGMPMSLVDDTIEDGGLEMAISHNHHHHHHHHHFISVVFYQQQQNNKDRLTSRR